MATPPKIGEWKSGKLTSKGTKYIKNGMELLG